LRFANREPVKNSPLGPENMRRKLLIIVVLILVVGFIVTVRYARQLQAQRKREAGYQVALQGYSQMLRLGMTRKDVEDQIRTKGITFQQICCIDERSAYADLLRIGKEGAPWYCSEQNIYIAFQFSALEPHMPVTAYDSDVLKRITIFRWLEGCL
jgi:hypothetical protein